MVGLVTDMSGRAHRLTAARLPALAGCGVIVQELSWLNAPGNLDNLLISEHKVDRQDACLTAANASLPGNEQTHRIAELLSTWMARSQSGERSVGVACQWTFK